MVLKLAMSVFLIATITAVATAQYTTEKEGFKCKNKPCTGIPSPGGSTCPSPNQNACNTYFCTKCNGSMARSVCWAGAPLDKCAHFTHAGGGEPCGYKVLVRCSPQPNPDVPNEMYCGCGAIDEGAEEIEACMIAKCVE